MLSIEELNVMRKMDIRKVDRNDLTDIRDIKIDPDKPADEKINDYLKLVHNPYMVLVGDYVLKLDYDDDGEDINDRMLAYISKMADIIC